MARARVEGITKPIRLDQLAAELGTDQVFGSGPSLGVTTEVEAEVPQATLEAAIAAHVADELYGEPAEDQNLAGLRAKARLVFDGSDTFSALQLQKLVAALVLRITRR